MKPVCTNHKIHNFSPSGLSRKKNVPQGYYMPCFEHGSVRKCFLLSLTCFLLAILLSQGWAQSQKEALAGRLAPSVLRFHVLAESDSREDQQVKLEVRSLLLDYLKKHLPDQADKADTIACLKKNRAGCPKKRPACSGRTTGKQTGRGRKSVFRLEAQKIFPLTGSCGGAFTRTGC